MDNTTLYRRKLMPPQFLELKDDHIIFHDDELIITTWNTINPKANLTHGISCYFLKEGIKVSKFYNGERFKFWYCDIVRTEYIPAGPESTSDPGEQASPGETLKANSYLFTDLIIDVIIRPDGSSKVVDLDELGEALSMHLITAGECSYALGTADNLLRCIYNGEFYKKIALLESMDPWKSIT